MEGENIYLLDDGGQLRPMAERPYAKEDDLQKLLEDWPELLAGSQINRTSPRRWILVSREAAVPDSEESGGRWSVDHLFLDQDAIPTLVEVKRSSDTRIRREVVGQMLDYAANAVSYWTIQTVRAKYNERCALNGIDPAHEIADLIGKPPEDDEAIEAFWKSVDMNLRAGKLRLLFVADQIPDELDRIVQFLNGQMNPAEVLAVQVKQFAGDGGKVLVPRVLGQTAASQRAKSTGRREKVVWDEARFFETLTERCDPETVRIVRDLYEWAQTEGLALRWGTGIVDGSFTAGVPGIVEGRKPPGLFNAYTGGGVQICLDTIRGFPPFERLGQMDTLVERLNAVLSTPLKASSQYPTIPAKTFSDSSAATKFKETFHWVHTELKGSAGG